MSDELKPTYTIKPPAWIGNIEALIGDIISDLRKEQP